VSNNELPLVKAADLVNYVVLASMYTLRSYRTVQLLATGKMLTADLRNIQ